MKPYLKNVNTLILDKELPFAIQCYGCEGYYVIDLRYDKKIRFLDYENSIFCVLTMAYDYLANSFYEMPLADVFVDFELLSSKMEILCGYKDFEDDEK